MPSVNFPLRVVLAIVVIVAFYAITIWGVLALVRAPRLTEAQRMVVLGAILLFLALLIGWVILF